jgi:hypothetical protein
MSNVASITAVTAASRSGSVEITVPKAAPVTAPAPTTSPSTVQSKTEVQQDAAVQDNSTAASTAASAVSFSSSGSSVNPHLPLGLLLAVAPPASDNSAAGSDYMAMQDALRTNNLSAAQQAYQRLQGDLEMNPAAVSATKTIDTGVATAHGVTSGTADANKTPKHDSLNEVA